jgi:hypothetical protein
MRISDMREGNIISDMTMSKERGEVEEAARFLEQEDQIQTQPAPWAQAHLDRIVEHAVENGLFAVCLSPSYGATLVALCERCSWSPVWHS